MRVRRYDPRQLAARIALGQVEPETGGIYRAPFLVELNASGARGAPLTALRPLRVLPVPPSVGDGVPQAPAVDLSRIWPWIFPPEDAYPIWRTSPTTTVAAGATSNLITIQELPRAYRGVVKKFGQTSADFTNIAWTFIVKGSPKDPVIRSVGQFGLLNQPTDLPGPGVILNPGEDFIVQATNLSGAPIAGVAARVDLFWWRI